MNFFSNISKICLIVFILSTNIIFSEVFPASLFQDNMVLQRQQPIAVFGKATNEKTIEITFKGKTYKAEVINGKWKVFLDASKAGGPFNLVIKGENTLSFSNILVGEVWLCSGQSNMEMPLAGFKGQPVYGSNEVILNADNSNIRIFKVARKISDKPIDFCEGDWQLAAPKTVKNFSATAYFFGKMLQEELKIPIGLIVSSWGGTPAESWTPEETLENEFKDFEGWNSKPNQPHKFPKVLYNGMIAPLIPYTIKGAIWYQGEANKKRAKQYVYLFPSMIKSWRDNWGQGDFPFYFVQIAPFSWGGDDNNVLLRESQLKTMQSVINTGMVVTLDIGEPFNIHPPRKREVGERLALWALAKNYGFEGVSYSGPIYKSMSVEENKAILRFDYAPLGVCTMGKELKDFIIAGQDQVFYEAEAKINKGRLEVWSDKVEKPVAVRYGWKGWVGGSLFNTAGLPASSFRTDDW